MLFASSIRRHAGCRGSAVHFSNHLLFCMENYDGIAEGKGLASPSGVRSICPSVCLSRRHTHRDSPRGSIRRGQRTFRPANSKEDRHSCCLCAEQVEGRDSSHRLCDKLLESSPHLIRLSQFPGRHTSDAQNTVYRLHQGNNNK